ncbi:MAG: sulfide-dependent adenosine diphosphate thiazole synthase [Desulfonatronovibrionaceae bacterium]
MALEEKIITEAIAERYFEKFRNCLDLDVAIVGGGPSGMTAGYKLAGQGYRVAMFERKLSLGGGMWGGGMTFNFIVVQQEGRRLLEEIGLELREYRPGYFTADAVTATTTLASAACRAGLQVFNCVSVEDTVIRHEGSQKKVSGLVINYSPVEIAGLHVDPLMVKSKFVIEATGHDTELLHTLVRKNDIKLNTPSGNIEGEQSMWVEQAESNTVKNTKEVFPGVYVTGMAANACFGSYRMGPIFGGMLLSGEKAAQEISKRLKNEDY